MPSFNADELMDSIRTQFVMSGTPTTAWGNAISAFLQIPALRALYNCGASYYDSTPTLHLPELAYQNHTIVESGNPTIGYEGILSYRNFGGTGWYAHASNHILHRLTGTAGDVPTEIDGLTIGGWFRPEALEGVEQALINKSSVISGDYGYRLRINTSDRFELFLSQSNSDSFIVANTLIEPSLNTWYFVVGRYERNTTDMFITVNDQTNTNTTAPTSVYNSSNVLRIGAAAAAGTYVYTGDMAFVFLSHAYVSDLIIKALYHHTRYLFGV